MTPLWRLRPGQTVELKAGRELDALVAERVMGLIPCAQWRSVNFGSGGGPTMMSHSEKDSPHPGQQCYPAVPGLDHPYNKPASYSTDIAAAWQVVERMRELGFRCMLELLVSAGTIGPPWHVNPEVASASFRRVGGEASLDEALHKNWWYSKAETMPLAICIAVLKSIGSDRPDFGGKP
jgi:hypothetical protein